MCHITWAFNNDITLENIWLNTEGKSNWFSECSVCDPSCTVHITVSPGSACRSWNSVLRGLIKVSHKSCLWNFTHGAQQFHQCAPPPYQYTCGKTLLYRWMVALKPWLQAKFIWFITLTSDPGPFFLPLHLFCVLSILLDPKHFNSIQYHKHSNLCCHSVLIRNDSTSPLNLNYKYKEEHRRTSGRQRT